MAIISNYEYLKPNSVDEALNLLEKYENSKIFAGGTDLLNMLKEGIIDPEALVDIKAIDEFKKLEYKEGILSIGSLVTFTELIDSQMIRKEFPMIMEVSETVASMGVRNRATMVGNICSAVPCMDSGSLLVVYEAKIHTISKDGKREIPALDFFVAPRRTALKHGEIVTHITIENKENKHSGAYGKLSRYKGEDLSQASISILALDNNKYKISFCSVGPVPTRATELEEIVNGNELTDEIIAKGKDIIPNIISPISDIRSTKEYRIHMCQVMFERGIKNARDRFNGKGTKYGTHLV